MSNAMLEPDDEPIEDDETLEVDGEELEVELEIEDGELSEEEAPIPPDKGVDVATALFKTAADIRREAMASIAEYLDRTFAIKEDDNESERLHLGLRTPIEDKDLDTARTLYMIETFRSFREARAAAAQISFHSRVDSRRLSDLLGRVCDLLPLGQVLPAPQK